jgi:hypothetical protein
MRRLAPILLLGLATLADAKDPSPGKGFWRILVKPNAKWVLKQKNADKNPNTITVETYDVRKVGKADVARLRWTYNGEGGKQDLSGQPGKLDQVAVTDAGLYLLTADMDDKKIAKALEGKPSRSDPPKPYKGTTENQGRYLNVNGGSVCIGEGPLPGAGDCEDVCFAELCMSDQGIDILQGRWAPNFEIYER